MASLEIGYRDPSGFSNCSSSAILEYVLQAVAYGSFFFGAAALPYAAPPIPPNRPALATRAMSPAEML